MAAIEVTITGMLYDKLARTMQNVVLIGEASLTGLGVGGGPVIPPPPSGGAPPHPEHPIYPGAHPEHPIVNPPQPPTEPPTDTVPGGDKPPPDTGGWGYVAQWSDGSAGGWGYFPGSSGAGPKR